jgi:hypothetical protein
MIAEKCLGDELNCICANLSAYWSYLSNQIDKISLGVIHMVRICVAVIYMAQ